MSLTRTQQKLACDKLSKYYISAAWMLSRRSAQSSTIITLFTGLSTVCRGFQKESNLYSAPYKIWTAVLNNIKKELILQLHKFLLFPPLPVGPSSQSENRRVWGSAVSSPAGAAP